MKTKLLMKSLLVAAMLGGGMNAWATTYTGTVKFQAKNRITNNNDGTFTTAGNAGNEYALALADLSDVENIGGATSITLEFDCNIPSGSRWLVGIGDKNTRGVNANGSSKSTYNTDGLVMRFGTTDGTYYRINGGTNNSNAFGVNAHCSFTLDIANKKYSYTIKDGETTLFSASNVNTNVTAANVVEVYSWLNNTTIAVSDVSYSFEYEASSYTYTVNAIDGDNNVLKVIDSNTTTESSVKVIYPYAIKIGNDWYTTSAANYSVTVNAINPNANITYTKDETIVAFFEGEAATGDNPLYSNGGYGTVAARNHRDQGISAGTLAPGKYQFVGRLVADGNSGRAITIREGANDPMASLIGSNTTKIVTEDFTVKGKTGNLYINGANSGTVKTNLSTSFDYVLIKRTGDCDPVSVTANTYGYQTFASDYALDFSSTTTKAYIATGLNGGSVTMQQVTKVPAGTGLFLQCSANEEIPVLTGDAEDVSANKLVRGTGAEVAKADGKDRYVLAPSGTSVAFFLINATAATISTSQAYLEVSAASGDARLTIDTEEKTGINAVESSVNDAEGYYNLNGQRVMNPSKGLYIVNGKKVIKK